MNLFNLRNLRSISNFRVVTKPSHHRWRTFNIIVKPSHHRWRTFIIIVKPSHHRWRTFNIIVKPSHHRWRTFNTYGNLAITYGEPLSFGLGGFEIRRS
ncbi:MAG: hypothetical protein E7069_09575 [Bacteroidales bacterium]|nr:hypothetical protein [Bacteroidales bacterium]